MGYWIKDADAYWYLTTLKPTYVVGLAKSRSLAHVTLIGYVWGSDRDTRRSKQSRRLVVCQGGYIPNDLEPYVDTSRVIVGKDSIAYTISVHLYTILLSP